MSNSSSSNNNHHQHHPMGIYNQLPRPAGPSRMKAAAGEIVEVQGGHIVRSTGRKDRHSKVCTSKGPRDRRVRLSAHTAIQFYDVQDRLGYDRPSKAVDWLIKNAKAAIDELAELPPWQPSATPLTTATANVPIVDREMGGKNAVSPPMGAAYNYTGSDLLPPSLESDAIADTIKYFFPIAAGPTSSSSNYPSDLALCHGTQNQDLRLSLQSFQDPILIHSQSATSSPMSFDAAAWSQPNQQRVVHWNLGGNGGGGDIFNLTAAQQQEHHAAAQPSHAVPLHQLLMQGTAMTQRGPLQSNSPQAFRTWMDPTAATIHHAEFPGFASGNFSGFRIPARIQGDEEHASLRGKPSSSTSLPSRR